MDGIHSILGAYTDAKENAIRGDFIDRLHSKHTVVLIVVIIMLIGFKQYNEDMIKCWLPAHLNGEQGNYAHQLCWVNSTYHFPGIEDADRFPQSDRFKVKYYQFILFILAGQVLLFMVPTYIWNKVSASSGGYIKKLLDQTERSANIADILENEKKRITKLEEKKAEKLKRRAAKEVKLLKSTSISSGNESIDEMEGLLTSEFKEGLVSDFNSLIENVYNEPKQAAKLLKATNIEQKTDLAKRNGSEKKKAASYAISKVLNAMKPKAGLRNLVNINQTI
jgi:hypothetical protein